MVRALAVSLMPEIRLYRWQHTLEEGGGGGGLTGRRTR